MSLESKMKNKKTSNIIESVSNVLYTDITQCQLLQIIEIKNKDSYKK